ncbi:hypothetical protein ACFUC1_02255 [Pedococcus sp. NPDC057267]|uniref:hypothetical protein n=1 Tax=Pedococcus sp. NPDC057267 TaxID=3346077 RepID=UPI0036288B52
MRKWLAAGAVVTAMALGSCSGQASPSHPARPGEPALVQVSDFSYEDYTPAEAARIDISATVDGLNAWIPGLVTGSSVHWVHGGSGETVTLVEFQLDPSTVKNRSSASRSAFENPLLEGVLASAAGAFAPATEQRVLGQRVGVSDATDRTGARRVVYAWLRHDVVTVVISRSLAQVQAYATSALSADR